MERRVKERLVGAAVLVATAVVFIPEMLSGPKRDPREIVVAKEGDGPFKTYTIDLNKSAATGDTPAVVEERAPPLEISAPQPEMESGPSNDATPPENATAQPQASPEPPQREAPPPARIAEAEPARSKAAPAQTPTPSSNASTQGVASRPNVPTSRGWAVQLGSFSSRATAEGMVKDLSASEFNAFVMPVKSGNATLYRVRIGPFAERAAAEATLANVKARASNAAVVAHP